MQLFENRPHRSCRLRRFVDPPPPDLPISHTSSQANKGTSHILVYEGEREYFLHDSSSKIIQDDDLARLISFYNVFIRYKNPHPIPFTLPRMKVMLGVLKSGNLG